MNVGTLICLLRHFLTYALKSSKSVSPCFTTVSYPIKGCTKIHVFTLMIMKANCEYILTKMMGVMMVNVLYLRRFSWNYHLLFSY